jgi:hypothetical protein
MNQTLCNTSISRYHTKLYMLPTLPYQASYSTLITPAATANRTLTQTAVFSEAEASIDSYDKHGRIFWQYVCGRDKKEQLREPPEYQQRRE